MRQCGNGFEAEVPKDVPTTAVDGTGNDVMVPAEPEPIVYVT